MNTQNTNTDHLADTVAVTSTHDFYECTCCAIALGRALKAWELSTDTPTYKQNKIGKHVAAVRYLTDGARAGALTAHKYLSLVHDTVQRLILNDDAPVSVPADLTEDNDMEDNPNHPANAAPRLSDGEYLDIWYGTVTDRAAAQGNERAARSLMVQDRAEEIYVHKIERAGHTTMGNPIYRFHAHGTTFLTSANIGDVYTINSGSPQLGSYLVKLNKRGTRIQRFVFLGA